jgi:hypothetical protein
VDLDLRENKLVSPFAHFLFVMDMDMDWQFKAVCGQGRGVAVCSDPVVAAACGQDVQDDVPGSALSVWSFTGSKFVLIWKCRGFEVDYSSAWHGGYVAFLPGRPLLLLADAHGGGAIHVLNAVTQSQQGFLVAPGTIRYPRNVAARGSFVAVLSGRSNVVVLHESSDCVWHLHKVLQPGLSTYVQSICFSWDGLALIVIDGGNCYSAVRHVDVRTWRAVLSLDVDRMVHEVQEEPKNTFVAATFFAGVVILQQAGHRLQEIQRYVISVNSAVMVPGLGLVVRESTNGCVTLLTSRDLMAMANMSLLRVAWMTAVFAASVIRDTALHSLHSLR